ncbi:hypothetical protein Cgig2_000939 [Carnegiea gigantea]|uniref:Uncharacterized protein n=1 Tax=Carnegiea gigantea TaxID=171969 RepID=A0A9Q1QKX2_9CARY|nr:hypothetical protein Cgig2_000939 [Carnegiea gigantea]
MINVDLYYNQTKILLNAKTRIKLPASKTPCLAALISIERHNPPQASRSLHHRRCVLHVFFLPIVCNSCQNLWRGLLFLPTPLKVSARNSTNRSYYKKDRLHRIGSKPYQQVAWELDEIRDVMEKDPSLSQMEVAEKVFKSKFRSQVLSLRGGVKPKDVRGSYSTRAELEVELNATRKKNEVLTDRLATVEAENEKLQNCIESVETEMMEIKDLVFQQFNTRPPSNSCDGHKTRGSNLISIFILFFENWFGLNVGRYLDGVSFCSVMVK